MTAGWGRKREQARDAVELFADILGDPNADDRRIVVAYLETKKVLAEAMQAMAVEKYVHRRQLAAVKGALERTMLTQFSDFPQRYLKVQGFGTVHDLIFAYLAERSGQEVSAGELRILTKDAVHTERRTRDLRDLGFDLHSRESGGVQVYVLVDEVPNMARGAVSQIAKNVRADKQLPVAERERLLSQLQTVDDE